MIFIDGGVCVTIIEVVDIGRQKVKVSGRNYINTVLMKFSKKKKSAMANCMAQWF